MKLLIISIAMICCVALSACCGLSMSENSSSVAPSHFSSFSPSGVESSVRSGSQSSMSSSVKSSATSSAPYQYLGSIQSPLAIKSATTGITYPYHVYLPHNYDISNKNYAIIYCADAQWYFSSFTKIIDMKNKDVIFIGIEEGPLKSDRRYIDFVLPGATKYMDFFKNEFVPMIEKTYRTNHERTFVGTSYGGLLGGIFLSKEPVGVPYFKNYMLFDASFSELKKSNIEDEEQRFNASNTLNINLILTSANVNPGNWQLVDTYQRRYKNRNYEGLNIMRRSYQLNHFDIPNPSFEDAIDLVY